MSKENAIIRKKQTNLYFSLADNIFSDIFHLYFVDK
jgi:hypothetical protein